jgi:predicted dehydrogenase
MKKSPVKGGGDPKLNWKFRLREGDLPHRLAQTIGWSERDKSKSIGLHYSGNGYHYEADEVRDCVQRGAKESSVMPLSDSVEVARIVDAIRAQVAGSTKS